MRKTFGRLDVLINNAAVLVAEDSGILETRLDDVRATKRSRVLVNCANPGWVRTRMGGSPADRLVVGYCRSLATTS